MTRPLTGSGFTERLRQQVDSIWEAQHQHPFVRGIGNGTLDIEKFKVWVRQDYLFLIDYGCLLALAVARRATPTFCCAWRTLATLPSWLRHCCPACGAFVKSGSDLLDRLADGLPDRDLRRLEEAFVTSSRYEWRFWDMAWRRESWQV